MATRRRSRIDSSKKLPFYVVQEGIWKNRASERVRLFLAGKFSERAEIELRYIRLLQDWMDGINPPIDKHDGSDSYMDTAVIKSMIECLKMEAKSQINSHQRVYNSVMNDLGPYCAIRREVTHNNKNLQWVEEKFFFLDRDRRNKEKEERHHTEKKEHISNQIEALENQLSQRSRITSARRSSRQGAKKVDGMRLRVSFLRKQLQDEEEILRGVQRDLLHIETKSVGDLGAMELVLRDLEKIRLQNMLQQTKLFIQSMLNEQTHTRRSACTGDALRQCVAEINEVEKLIDTNWDDVELNAQRSQAGQIFKLRQLFEVPVKKPSSADSRKSVDSRRIAEIEASRLNESLDENDERQDDESPAQDNRPEGKDNNDNTAQAADSNSTRESDVNENISESSIEDLNLPPETRNSAVRPKNVVRDFWIKSTKEELSEGPQHETEYTQVLQLNNPLTFCSGVPDFDSNAEIDIGQLRNIKVRAVVDFIATSPAEISFKKGQTIKQKVGENENGYCYGWTRDHRLFPKRYGYYPKTAVGFTCSNP